MTDADTVYAAAMIPVMEATADLTLVEAFALLRDVAERMTRLANLGPSTQPCPTCGDDRCDRS
jgi:hypothetical protein